MGLLLLQQLYSCCCLVASCISAFYKNFGLKKQLIGHT